MGPSATPPWYVVRLVLVPQGPYKSLEDLWDEPQPDYQALREQVRKRYTNIGKQLPSDKLNSGEQGNIPNSCVADARCGKEIRFA